MHFFHRSFRQKVVINKKEPVYQAVGGHTFFIPVEEGFKVIIHTQRLIIVLPKFNYKILLSPQPPPRSEMIDKKVIDGHIIPNKVIFTNAAKLDEPMSSMAFEDNLKVTLTLFTQTDGKTVRSKCD